MENKFVKAATFGSVVIGGIFFFITLVNYHCGASLETLLYWVFLTIFMYASHIILRIGEVKRTMDDLSEELADLKMMVMLEDRTLELKELKKLVEEVDKQLEEEEKK